MPTVSLPTAEFLFNVSSVALIAGALAVFAGTIGTVWMGSVKERFGDERISANEKEAAQARRDAANADERAAQANERAAEANAEAKKAQLALEKYRAPRSLPANFTDNARSILRQFLGKGIIVGASPETVEAMIFAEQIIVALNNVGITAGVNQGAVLRRGGVAQGIVVMYTNGNDFGRSFAEEISKLFSACGMEAPAFGGLDEDGASNHASSGGSRNDEMYSSVIIIVGSKN